MSGFQAIRRAMDFNKTLAHWEYPLADYGKISAHPKARALLDEINMKINSNGGYEPPEVFTEFALDWETPSRPAPGTSPLSISLFIVTYSRDTAFGDIPQYLKDSAPPPDDLTKLLAKSDPIPASAAASTPTSTPPPKPKPKEPEYSDEEEEDQEEAPTDELPPVPPPELPPAPPPVQSAPPTQKVNRHVLG